MVGKYLFFFLLHLVYFLFFPSYIFFFFFFIIFFSSSSTSSSSSFVTPSSPSSSSLFFYFLVFFSFFLHNSIFPFLFILLLYYLLVVRFFPFQSLSFSSLCLFVYFDYFSFCGRHPCCCCSCCRRRYFLFLSPAHYKYYHCFCFPVFRCFPEILLLYKPSFIQMMQLAGCDNELNSRTKLDECGVCGGNNSTCKRTTKTWHQKVRWGK